MNEYTNLTLENIDKEHICCTIGDSKHQCGVDNKKEWIKTKLKDGHIFRKLNARGKIFIEYESVETAWVPILGKNYEYIYCFQNMQKRINITINFIKIDILEKAKNVPCVFNNWANFYKGKFVSNTILNANSFEKMIKE